MDISGNCYFCCRPKVVLMIDCPGCGQPYLDPPESRQRCGICEQPVPLIYLLSKLWVCERCYEDAVFKGSEVEKEHPPWEM